MIIIKRITHFILLSAIASWLLVSCKSDGNINLGNNPDGFTIEQVDSVNIEASTCLLDSLPTLSTGKILVGNLVDPDFGKLNVSSYLQIKPDSYSQKDLPLGARFDSLSLVLPYNGYAYGDTTLTQEISVNRLTETMELKKASGIDLEGDLFYNNTDAFFSTSKFKHEPIPLGTVQFRPKPKSKDSISIRLNATLGAELFNMVLKNNSIMKDEEKFLNFFKGIVVQSKTTGNVIGFSTESLKMYVHYSYPSNDGLTKKERLPFVLRSSTYQFNRLNVDRANTKIAALQYNSKELKGEVTNQQLFIQGGTGIVTKIKLPGLVNLATDPKVVLNKVELIIETLPDSYKTYNAPNNLILLLANKQNRAKSYIYEPYQQQIQQAKFQIGNDVGSNGRYVFQLIEYANKLRQGDLKDYSIMISLPIEEMKTTVDRLLIGNKKNNINIKTRILYTKF